MPIPAPRVRSLAENLHVWLPRQAGWGLANCGLLVGTDSALWIDTPYDRVLAEDWLARSRELMPAGQEIERIAVTHGNGDHLWGACVLPDAEVITTRHAEEQTHFEPSPHQVHQLLATIDRGTPLGWYFSKHFGVFDWSRNTPVAPTRLIDEETVLETGAGQARLVPLPRAHTTGDLMIHLPRHGVVFSGDVIFASSPEQPGDHPIHWAGPLAGVIEACRAVLATGATTIVPGHGPVLDRAGVAGHIGYLEYLGERIHALHGEGLDAQETARRIVAERRFPTLHLPERLAATVATEYRHLDGGSPRPALDVLTAIAQLAVELEQPALDRA